MDPRQASKFQASVATVMGDESQGRLPHAVIVPQRRPKKRVRGFVRAYAPDLIRCGIDQPTFLAFIDGLNESISLHPAVAAVNMAGMVAGLVPNHIAQGVGLAVSISAGAYTEVQARKSQNEFLLKMNNELFRPRGLYCLIMAYDTNSRSRIVQHDLAVEPSSRAPAAGQSSGFLRGRDGVLGADSLPTFAELIYPDSKDAPPPYEDEDEEDDSSSQESGEEGGSSSKGGGFSAMLSKAAEAFNKRSDHKAQVKFQRRNPHSAINSLLDPDAELSKRDLRRQDRRAAKQDRKLERQERRAERRERRHPGREPRRRKVKEGILYLMIVNMPSAEDMEMSYRLAGTSS
ncbi:hypothetical protein F4778DRAFT_734775 [Xylariomycetidae sp. FL2044]|nr:hypothetical protein F4778DRAFT_734775 [Xylariomycetidae sp. FL2044]